MEDLRLSIPSDRLIGFTVPENNRFLVCDHDEVWEVVVGSSVNVKETDYAPYTVAERPDFIGWGRTDAKSILVSDQTAISYNFDPKASTVQVRYKDMTSEGQIDFPTFSGDWFCASLSRDGQLLVLAEPYKIGLFRTSA